MASITTATSGLSTATSTWTGGVVPVVGDKVTIQHPGTNSPAAGTQYLLNGAHTLGATSIVLKTGTGSIVAGECVQFEHQIGTDEDAQPIYDNTYYKVTTGIAAPGTIVITPGLAYAMASDVRVVNRGHVVELAGVHVWGDDTSSLTPASNGIDLLGAIKASRSVNSSLTCRGTLFQDAGGTLDLGQTGGDIIPAGVTFALVLNDSAALAAGKHGFANSTKAAVDVKMAGAVRTRNTRLTSGIAAAATSIVVDASTGWAIGDRIVIASDTDDSSRAQVTTITAGTSPTWTVGAIILARLAGCRVGNLSSNVTIKPAAASSPSFFVYLPNGSNTSGVLRISDVRFEDMGSNASWVTLAPANVNYQGALQISHNSGPMCTVRRPAFEATTTAATRALTLANPSLNRHRTSDAAIYYTANNSVVQCHTGASQDCDAIVYRTGASNAITSNNSDGSAGCIFTGEYWAFQLLSFSPSVYTKVLNAVIHATNSVNAVANGFVDFDSCTISSPLLNGSHGVGTIAVIKYLNSTFQGATLAGSFVTGSKPAQASVSRIYAANGTASDNRVLSYYQSTTTDLTTRKRSTYAVNIQPKVANTAITYTFTLPAVGGVAQTIKGSLRFDATYGTATPPSIALSGQGVTQSYTCTATANTWFDFAFSFTPTSTGDITATVTVQSASTAGFAWLDGVYHYPMTQSVRHFGYLWQPQAAQVADPSITVSEATALAYPVAVNHGTSTITVSGAATARQVYEACMADLVQTANQGTARHITTSDLGASFATGYTVALSGAGAVSGVYTDAAGLHVAITAPTLLAGSRVQLYNLTDGAELYNAALAVAGLALPIVWTADKTIRLRAAWQSGASAKVPLELVGVLTSAGLSFVASQVDDAVYIANSVDGSTCTEFTPDYPNLQIDVSDPDGVTTVQRVYAWSCMANATATGIQLMFGAVSAADALNYVIDVAKVNAKFDNVSGAPVVIGGGYIRRSDGASVIAATSGSIQMDPGRAYLAPASVPSASTVATAVRSELATELAATLQARDLAEADVVFTPGGTAGTGTLAYHRRGTSTDLIPAKAVVGTSQTQPSGATQ